MDKQKFNEVFVGPMEALYGPCRRNSDQSRFALKTYFDKLSHYSEKQLVKAVDEAMALHSRWPSLAEMMKLCRQYSVSVIASNSAETLEKRISKMEWRAREIAEYFLVNYFKTSTLYSEALQEGWSAKLRDVVRNIAKFQSEVLHYDSRMAIGYGCSFPFSYNPNDTSIRDYMLRQRENAERNRCITIDFSDAEIEYMRSWIVAEKYHKGTKEFSQKNIIPQAYSSALLKKMEVYHEDGIPAFVTEFIPEEAIL